MGRRKISGEEYDEIEFDHAEETDGGRVLLDSEENTVGTLYYETSVSNAIETNSLEFED